MTPCPVFMAHWWQLHPPVGVFIGILGVLGVVVPWLFRPLDKMGIGKRIGWHSFRHVFRIFCDRKA